MAAERWEVFIDDRAGREIHKLPRDVRDEAFDLIESLQDDPFQHNAIELRRNNGFYRIYFGNDRYRLIYRVNRAQRTVNVRRARRRGDAYKGMRNP